MQSNRYSIIKRDNSITTSSSLNNSSFQPTCQYTFGINRKRMMRLPYTVLIKIFQYANEAAVMVLSRRFYLLLKEHKISGELKENELILSKINIDNMLKQLSQMNKKIVISSKLIDFFEKELDSPSKNRRPLPWGGRL